jgi:protein phosphatase
MGGGNSGEVVSELTANWIMKDYYDVSSTEKSNVEYLKEIILDVNNRIIKLSSEHDIYDGMGSTLLALLFYEEKAFIYSVGDSRIYLLRANKLQQITEDQSEVWELYKKNVITKEEMRHHPNKHILSNAIGNKNKFRINFYEQKIEKDDLFLMCSDGLTDMLTDNEIEKILEFRLSSLKKKGQKLIKDANTKGGKDNITAIIIKI